jgi:hypothetical protein
VGPVVRLVIDPIRKESIDVDLPFTFRTDPATMRAELGLPDFVDVSDPTVARAIGLLHAVRHAAPPLAVAFFGGVANRLLVRASNDAGSGLRHPLHDLDLAGLRREAKPLRAFLLRAHEVEGSALRFLETPGDRIFNSLGEGGRYRLHDLRSGDGSRFDVGTVDLIADEFRFCHRIDLRVDVATAAGRGGTLSPTSLFLAKLQFIQRVPESARAGVAERVLEPFGRHELVLGPETKDRMDLLALLSEFPLGAGDRALSLDRIRTTLKADGGFHRTAMLNLGLLTRSVPFTTLGPELRDRIAPRLEQIRQAVQEIVPRRRFGLLGGPWWDEVDALPSVDTTVRAA